MKRGAVIQCKECGCNIPDRPERKNPLCRSCWLASIKVPPSYCRVCGVKVSSYTRQKIKTLCTKHAAQQPERRAKISAAMKATHAQPGVTERYAKAMRATKLADVPLEYRDEYMMLSKSKRIKRAERLEIIANQVRRDADRYHQTGQLQRSQTRK